jgi:hypothetical protein
MQNMKNNYVTIGYTIKQKKSIDVLHWGMPLSLGNTLLINFLGKEHQNANKKLNPQHPHCKVRALIHINSLNPNVVKWQHCHLLETINPTITSFSPMSSYVH